MRSLSSVSRSNRFIACKLIELVRPCRYFATSDRFHFSSSASLIESSIKSSAKIFTFLQHFFIKAFSFLCDSGTFGCLLVPADSAPASLPFPLCRCQSTSWERNGLLSRISGIPKYRLLQPAYEVEYQIFYTQKLSRGCSTRHSSGHCCHSRTTGRSCRHCSDCRAGGAPGPHKSLKIFYFIVTLKSFVAIGGDSPSVRLPPAIHPVRR